MLKKLSQPIPLIFISFALILLGATAGFFLRPQLATKDSSPPQNKYLAFIDQVHTTTLDNYWQKPSEYDLNQLFFKASQALTGRSQPQNNLNKDKLFSYIEKTLNQYDSPEKKTQYTLQLTQSVLTNLPPKNRNQLYTQQDQKDLARRVQNKAQSDHYDTLDIESNASSTQVEQAYQEKLQDLNQSTASAQEKQTQIAQLEQAQQTLTDQNSRTNYDQSGVDPTTSYRLLTPQIAYLKLAKFSPHTYSDLQNAGQQLVNQSDQLNTLILDLRDNVGGAIDGLPNFLGPFIGPDRLAYSFLHQGGKEPYRTQTGWLDSFVPYKKVIVLINSQTQSTAEVFAGAIKRYNVAVLVGTPTKGWGTVERVFPIQNQITSDQKHALLLVHRLTLDDNNQPIEGRGITPHINTNQDNWLDQFRDYYSSPSLTSSLQQLIQN